MSNYSVAYDIESTGKSPMVDKIVQICLISIDSEGKRDVLLNTLVNPEMPISEGASEVHGIYDSDVAEAPTFSQIADQLESYFNNAKAIIGYNSSKFDNTMLNEEFIRINRQFDISSKPQIDVKRLLEYVEPRDLNSVSERYLGKTIEGAHDACVDVEATLDIMEKLKEIGNLQTMKHVGLASTIGNGSITGDGRISWIDARVTISFGKWDGTALFDAVRADPRYFDWIINKADPAQYTWKSRDLCNCIRTAVNSSDEESMNSLISEDYGYPPHVCEDHLENSENIYSTKSGYIVEEWYLCTICGNDLTHEMHDMIENWEPDEDWGRDR